MTRTANVHCAAIPEVLGEPVVYFSGLRGQEGLGYLFKYTITLKSRVRPKGTVLPAAANMDLRALIGKDMSVDIELDGSGTGAPGKVGQGKREISGIVAEARFLGNVDGAAVYECELVPWLWLLTQRSTFKRYVNKDVRDVLDEVFSYYPYPVEKRLGKSSYPLRKYQAQYGETDHNFAVRLMQEWGIYYYFEHRGGQHTLVLCDGLTSHAEYDSAAYQNILYQTTDAKIDEEHIDKFEFVERLRAGAWSTSDFDFTRPKADLSVLNDQPRDTAHNTLGLFEWPGNYTKIAEGEEIARVRMEEQRAKGVRASGAGNLRAMVPGCAFTLHGHPHAACNQKYLLLNTSFVMQEVDALSGNLAGNSAGNRANNSVGSGGFSYRVEFEVQPITEIFRPERTLKKPKAGMQTATVISPPGQDLWTDEYGGVPLQFHWEPEAERDYSTFFRVSYPWSGDNYGVIYIPRAGQEVIIEHMNDDPDLPVVVGRVYNQLHMPPWDLPENSTQSGIKTRSTEGMHEGPAPAMAQQDSGTPLKDSLTPPKANVLRFEDKEGFEQVWLHASKDLLEEVENDRTIQVDGYDKLSVGKDKFTTVGYSSFESVALLKTVTVGGAMQTTIGGLKNETVALSSSEQVGMAKNSVVGAERSDNIGGFHFVNVGLYQNIVVGGARKLSVGAAYLQNVIGAKETGVGGVMLEKVGLDKTTVVGGAQSVTVGGARNVSVGGIYSQNVGGAMETGVGGASLEKVGVDKTTVVGGNQTVTVGKARTVTAGATIVVEAGASLVLKCGGSTITMTPGEISINAPTIKLN